MTSDISTTPETLAPYVRVHVGAVQHADGAWTFGPHVCDAAGHLTLVDPPVTVQDWDCWEWAGAQVPRVLRSEEVEPYVPLPPWAWEEV